MPKPSLTAHQPTAAAPALPFMSIVVISYNGAATIGRALESLINQDYPKDRYEIIVVDDGSTDTTPDVVATFPVRYHYQSNGGISRARNTGIGLAHGDIYVAFDDDCTADRHWLRRLASGYASGNPVGVGGSIASASQPRGLVQHYMDATGSGPSPSDDTTAKQSILGRLLTYWTSNFTRSASGPIPEKFAVAELYGANGSFPLNVLKKVGGWSTELSGIEDRALSKAIRLAYPKRPFFAVSQARITHEPELTLTGYLLRPWKRGPVNWAFHRQHGMLPPLFPLPFVLGLILLVTAVLDYRWLPLAAVFGPHILYAWWPYFAMRDRRGIELLFPYLQLAEESMVIAGLIRGAVRGQRRQHVEPAA